MKSMVYIMDLLKVTSQKHFVSDDLNPDLDPVQAIAPVFSETSRFFTPLQCDLEPEINNSTSRKIVVSSNLSTGPSSDLAWTGSRSGSRSDDTTIFLEAISEDGSGDINLPRGGIVYFRFKITLERCKEL